MPESRSERSKPVSIKSETPSGLISARRVPWLTAKVEQSAKWFWVLSVIVLVIGAVLRIVGMVDDFWLDEIWSWTFAMEKQSIVDIFRAIHHDNNHYLNTIWMHLVGDQPHLWLYRLHSFIAGLACICGCGLLAGDVAYDGNESLRSNAAAKRASKTPLTAPLIFVDSSEFARLSALIAMLLLATSYIPIVYSSEARGYSMAAAAAIYSTWMLRRIVRDRTQPRLLHQIGYAVLSIVGILSHLSYVTVLLPHLLWGAYELARRRRLTWSICFLPSLVAIAALWVIDLRFAVVGGAPKQAVWPVLLESLAMPLAIADNEGLLLVCASIISLLLISGFAYLRRAGFSDGLLFCLMFVIAPRLMIAMRSDGLLTTRHFIVVWICLYPLLGISVARLIGFSVAKISLMPVVLVIWLTANGWEFAQFAVYGRGHFDRATRWLVAETDKFRASAGERQSIGTDHDFRNAMVLSFYMRRLGVDAGLDYKKRGQWPESGVDWVMTHNAERGFEPPAEITAYSHQYDLVFSERFHAPIGWNWAIYHRHDRKID